MVTAESLVCFAVREEARHFSPGPKVRVLISGMGPENAARKLREVLSEFTPRLVLTCGFAGALNRGLRLNQVIFETEPDGIIASALGKCGAVQGRFYCSSRVLVHSIEKADVFKRTGADAVEMESGVIRKICAESGIPSATVRVISDTASESLPLDFNALMDTSYRINFFRLGCELIKSPGKIPILMKFQKQMIESSRALGATLEKALLHIELCRLPRV